MAKFLPHPYAAQARTALHIQTDQAHRLWSYQPDRGYYTLEETTYAVHRLVSTLVSQDNIDPRPRQGREVVEVLQDLVPKIVPGANGHHLACSNITLDLTNPAQPQQVEHSPDHYLTGGLPHPFTPNAKAPVWQRFLDQVMPDLDDQRLLCQFAGACLLDRPPPKGVIYLWGPADSGKSTICRCITFLLGRYNVSVVGPHDLSEDKFAVADLFGKMANIVPDIPTEPIRNTSKYKQVTGGDLVRGDIKYAPPIHFTSTAAILYSGNELPKSFNDPSDGFYNRQISIACPHKVEKPDPTLEPAIQAEAQGLLHWALLGLKDLWENNWQYAVPQKVKDRQAADYEAANHELAWIADRTLQVHAEFLTRQDAYTDYATWADKQGLKPWSRQRFYNRLRDHWGADRKTSNKRGWDGHALLI